MPNTNAIMEKTNPIFFYIKCQKYCRGKAIESNREFKQLIFLTYNVCFFLYPFPNYFIRYRYHYRRHFFAQKRQSTTFSWI